MAPRALSHGDGALGDGVEDCITSARRLWRAELSNNVDPPVSGFGQIYLTVKYI
jgi:hypothetical protein